VVPIGFVANSDVHPPSHGVDGLRREGPIGGEPGGRDCRNTLSSGYRIHGTAKRFGKEEKIGMRTAQAILLSRTNDITPDWFAPPANLRFEYGILVEHWDVLQDQARHESSRSGLTMFGDKLATCVDQRCGGIMQLDEAAAVLEMIAQSW